MTKSPLRTILLVAALVAMLAVPTALAGRGGGGKPGGGGTTTGGTGTISLDTLSSTDGLAHYGQKVTFNVWASSTTKPWVDLTCSQNGTPVYHQANGIFSTSLNQIFTLGPTPMWTGGDAECVAALQNWDNYSKGKIVTITTMAFHAYA